MKLDYYTRIESGTGRSPCQDACCAGADAEATPTPCGGQKNMAAVGGTVNKVEEGFHKAVFSVSGMDCGDCAVKLENYSAQIN